MGFRHTRGKRGSRGTRGRKLRGGAGQAKGVPGVHKGVTVNARNANTNMHSAFQARRKSNAYSGDKLKYLLGLIGYVIENVPNNTFTSEEKASMTKMHTFLSKPGKFTSVVGEYDPPENIKYKEGEILDIIERSLKKNKADKMLDLLEMLYLKYFP
jgi:hypothetical protein